MTAEKSGIYIHIAYSWDKSVFKTWSCVPTVIRLADKNLYVGYVVWAEPKLQDKLVGIIKKNIQYLIRRYGLRSKFLFFVTQ